VTAAAGRTINRLNVAASPINCFWQKDALEILPVVTLFRPMLASQ
jgi:hypothetical protein